MTLEQLAHFQMIAMVVMYQRLVDGAANGQVDSIRKTVFHFAIEPDRFSTQIIIG